MRRIVGATFAVVLLSRSVAAQDSTAQLLRQARSLYDRVEIELAVPLLRRVVSPEWAHPATPAQRAEAYKYLGAAEALAGRTEPAVTLFRTALEHDPFTDLNPDAFTPAQVGAFARARRQVLGVAVRPVAAARVDPRTERVRFTYVTTHAATLLATLRRGDTAFTVVEAGGEGVGEIVWDGLAPDGRLAPPGRYELRIKATSRVLTRSDSARAFFDLRHQRETLEDTLPDIPPGTLLPERIPGRVVVGEIGKGLAVAGGAFVISSLLTNSDLGDVPKAAPAAVAGVAVAAGVFAFFERHKARDLPQNVAINQQRRDERARGNQAIRDRNAARVAATILEIAPAAGVSP